MFVFLQKSLKKLNFRQKMFTKFRFLLKRPILFYKFSGFYTFFLLEICNISVSYKVLQNFDSYGNFSKYICRFSIEFFYQVTIFYRKFLQNFRFLQKVLVFLEILKKLRVFMKNFSKNCGFIKTCYKIQVFYRKIMQKFCFYRILFQNLQFSIIFFLSVESF